MNKKEIEEKLGKQMDDHEWWCLVESVQWFIRNVTCRSMKKEEISEG